MGDLGGRIDTLKRLLKADIVDNGLKAMKLLTEVGKQVKDADVGSPGDDEDGAGVGSGAGSGAGGGSGSSSGSGSGLSTEARALKAEQARAMKSIEASLKETAEMQAEVQRRLMHITELKQQGIGYFEALDDGDSEGYVTIAQAVLAGKDLAPLHDAGKWLEERMARDREKEVAAAIGKLPLKQIIAQFNTQVMGAALDVDDDIQMVQSEKPIKCPLTLKKFVEPVVTTCNHTFEKKALQGMFKGHHSIKCPSAYATAGTWRRRSYSARSARESLEL